MGQANGRKSVFVTGGASGIGAETARYFAKQGWFVGLFDVNAAGVADVAAEIGEANTVHGVFDVRDRDGWASAIEAFSEATGGQMHVLFNNAGIGRYGWFEDIEPEDSDAIVDINVKGVINGIYASLPLLKPTTGARIVNVASTAGVVGSPKLAVYSATKFAVRGLTEALDTEMSELDVKVTSLMPWFIDTPILQMAERDGANTNMKDQIEEDGSNVYPVSMAAEMAWEAAHGKEVHYMVGKDAKQARFMSRFFPGFLRNQISKNLPERE